MRVAVVTSSSTSGGAGKAAGRLHDGLRLNGVASELVVERRVEHGAGGAMGAVRRRLQARSIDAWPLALYPRRSGLFWLSWIPGTAVLGTRAAAPEIVNVHACRPGFLGIEALPRLPRPVIWTMHDAWPFTGGCHFTLGCERYRGTCGACPRLGSGMTLDLSRWTWRRKRRAYRRCDLTFVAPSTWLADQARQSSLLGGARVEVIPNGIDLDLYRDDDPRAARERLGLPRDRPVVVFGAEAATADTRKGFQFVAPTLRAVRELYPGRDLSLLVFGSRGAERSELPFPTTYLGQVTDEDRLRDAYCAGDVFLCPSVEDNLPNTVVEAMSCGTPTVAFDVCGLPDLIDHRSTGYLARPFEPADLARGLHEVIDLPGVRARTRARAVRDYDMALSARRYRMLFESVHRSHGSRALS